MERLVANVEEPLISIPRFYVLPANRFKGKQPSVMVSILMEVQYVFLKNRKLLVLPRIAALIIRNPEKPVLKKD